MESRGRKHAGMTSARTPPNSSAFISHTPGNTERRKEFSARRRPSIADDADADADVDSGARTAQDDCLLELINKTWNIWAVSPLFSLHYNDEVILKRYAKRMREVVANSLIKDNVSYKAKFTRVPELSCGPSDLPAMQVEVHSVQEQMEEQTTDRIYVGIFLSWGATDEPEEGITRLPILLSRGLQNITQIVHGLLSQFFDCSIIPMNVSQEDLMWLSTITLNSGEEVTQKKSKRKVAKKQFILEYRVPGLTPSDLIRVKFPMTAISTLWRCIAPKRPSTNDTDKNINGSTDVIKWEQTEKFYECIRREMLRISSIELGFCLLHKVTLPTFMMQSNKIKANDLEAMDLILWFFQERALRYTPFLIPMDEE